MVSQDHHSEDTASTGNYDLSFLLPVVTPIDDEYEEEEESGTKAGDTYPDADVDRNSLLGLTDRAARYQQFERDYHQDAVMEDDGPLVASDMEYSAASDELLYYHRVVARQAMSLGDSDVIFDDDEMQWSGFSASDHGPETTPSLPRNDPLLRHRSVPELPRPSLWTLSERGESIATKSSEHHYLGDIPLSPTNRSLSISDVSGNENEDPSEHNIGFRMWLNEAGAKVLTKPIRALTTLSHRRPKMARMALSSRTIPRRVSFQQEDLTVATATDSVSGRAERSQEPPMPSLTTNSRKFSSLRCNQMASF
mmetsp:Transcript_9878/g.18784  ORF Transcript_9878/g.18784 Transcript_9878/m.18784 type:complete len:309 (-) Transcript_9878:227-1153(-)|eukprot:CAMPEP_0197442670 /NCGR_PEP_ID=MMETSP1175-20131217/8635_1 /TAXON_ID=1003142 /ORGANISM="Triceratium dubium, Strain CCMP147" /LENGTH=308 /DNA_ID=CAMNT_0042973193 /DNA_START=496 /DNA_END=1425 /DNA_ORIENTATION=+